MDYPIKFVVTFTHHDDASHCDDYDGDELGDRKQILNFGG